MDLGPIQSDKVEKMLSQAYWLLRRRSLRDGLLPNFRLTPIKSLQFVAFNSLKQPFEQEVTLADLSEVNVLLSIGAA